MLCNLSRMIRKCSEVMVQNMTGYLIREPELRSGDIKALEKLGYSVYGVSQQENKPFVIENRTSIRKNRVGIVLFPHAIIFPERKDRAQDSAMNYYTLNNQYSWLSQEIIKKDFNAKINRPK